MRWPHSTRAAAFAKQHVIITGGSSGIGQATAVRLARRGAHVSIIARDPERLEAARTVVAAACVDVGQRVLAFAADVSDRAGVGAAIRTAIGRNGPPDMLVTSAGIAVPGYFGEIPLGVFEQTMATNYFGTLYAIDATVPHMREQGRGHLVLISSGAGLIGIFGYTSYSPTKFALRGLAESLRGEMRRFGIAVSIVYPPDTDTPQLARENETKPVETKHITGRARLWSADAVADRIVDGIERGTFAITPGLAMTMLASLHSVLAPGLHRYFDALAARARRAPR